MTRFSIFAALLVAAAAPAAAQDQPAPAQPAPEPAPAGGRTAIQQAAAAFNDCVSTGVRGIGAEVTPEAGAASVVAGCATQRQQLEQAVDAAVATASDADKATARQRLQTQLAQVEPRIAAAIHQQRGDAAPEAQPAPQPQPQS
jgi:hypothetical protein